ncbi:MAG: ferredoxin family protein [Lachnospiraceae bacterium]|nr:ferredoxin family protein [Lachnospiraceae bacterium]
MSIQILKNSCVGCGKCIEACPGNLIKKDKEGKAYIRHEKDCWGCTSCVKECMVHAIEFYLGADVGGAGSTLTVEKKGDLNLWKIKDVNGIVRTIEVNQKDANKY